MLFFKDNLIKHLLKNSAILLSGNAGAAVIGLVSLALTARSLGAEKFGVLVLITTYILIIDKLINFQSWQAIIKYGADALERKEQNDFRMLIKFGFLIDISASILGFVISSLSVVIVGYLKGWEKGTVLMVVLYSITILSHITGTPTAILRLFDRFKLLAYSGFAAALIKLAGVTVAYVMKADFWAYLLVWGITDIFGSMILVFLALHQLKLRSMAYFYKIKLKGITGKFKGIWGFVWTTNLSDSVRMSTREVDVFLIGVLLNPSSVAIYKIAKQIASIPSQFAVPVQQVIYPAMSKLWHAGEMKTFYSYASKVSFLMGAFGLISILVFWFMGEWLILLVFGEQYLEAFKVIIIFLGAYCVFYYGLTIRPIALIFGLHQKVFYVYLLSAVCFYIAYFPLIHHFKLVGAATSHLLFYLIWFFTMKYLIYRSPKAKNDGGEHAVC